MGERQIDHHLRIGQGVSATTYRNVDRGRTEVEAACGSAKFRRYCSTWLQCADLVAEPAYIGGGGCTRHDRVHRRQSGVDQVRQRPLHPVLRSEPLESVRLAHIGALFVCHDSGPSGAADPGSAALEWIDGSAGRDRMRFEEFAAARLPAMLRYAMLLSGDREDAHDIVQEVLARALVKWDRIARIDEPYAYVRRMVTNEFISRRRRRSVRTVPLTEAHEPAAPAGPEPGGGDDLWRLLAGLPRQQRAVLVLRYYEGLTDDEIAETLRCRAGTVRAYAARALAALRIELTDAEGALS